MPTIERSIARGSVEEARSERDQAYAALAEIEAALGDLDEGMRQKAATFLRRFRLSLDVTRQRHYDRILRAARLARRIETEANDA